MDSERLSGTLEDELVARLVRRLPIGRRVVAGAGDDCAAMRVPGRKDLQLLKTDCLVEDVHFRREHPAKQVGWKALCRAISDIAACGGKPDAALVTVAAPGDLGAAYLDGIYRGLARAARRYGVSIVGGETARSPGGLFLSIALTGWVKPGRLALRSGGRAGDALFVTGRLGGSFGKAGRGSHLSFTPRVAEGRWLAKRGCLHAMMDLSDGLGADLPRLADASRTGYAVDLESIPRRRGCTVERAVADGEDYELLIAVAEGGAASLAKAWRQKFPLLPLTRIGSLLANRRSRAPLARGYTHFAR
ncbi:MAG: thiamine-phosphate kinase [Terrimicrobiaceae bacterium]|nr:thiamine-phosphate kinase [Terrimicrobiaceae bacterium]